MYHGSLKLQDKMISFGIPCKELKLSCRYWPTDPDFLSHGLAHDRPALWLLPCTWNESSLAPKAISLLVPKAASLLRFLHCEFFGNVNRQDPWCRQDWSGG